ncbi:phosphatidate cytidylyltransferase [Neptunomonas antarctica]|uniref:Phosphatidate cytidylyltransferase n=1 Tax=Neptunomonas antarctica TaxID=619304 RepID=A0A1N7NE16_9GAMM|nr:phosphatidate cytidylyltransferase [Neptunomonas antarctica]SIS96594.1 phosphatidate cytidylyltransferase [Neptunomonas antarctica]
MFFNIPQYSFYTMATVVGLLVLATVVRLYLKNKYPATDYTELRQRIQSWWVMIGLLFVVLTVSKTAAVVFFGFLSFLALKEFLSIVPTRLTDRKVIFWAYLSIPFQYYWVSAGWYGMFIIFIPVYVFLFLPMCMVLKGDTKGFIRSAGIIHWATMLTVFSISHIAFLLMLPVKNELAGFVGPVLFLLFMTQFNDVCQYVWGKLLGKHKIIPKVSPNKTWEGFLGGLVTITICAGLVAPLLTPLSNLQGLMAGALIGASGFIGDVVISSVKRDLDIKDSGNFIPGHGGILDRLDSLTYTAPLFFHFLYYTYY